MVGVKDRLHQIRIHSEDQAVWLRFRRNLSVSLIGSGLALAIKLGQTALLTKLLRIEDYGRLLIVLNLFVFIESFVGLRVSDVVFRFFQPLQKQQEERALQGLLLVCLGISLVTGLLICVGVFVLSPWLADHFYHTPEIAPLFNIYGCTVLVSAFSGVYEPILRIYDRFTSIVVPQVVGSLATFIILGAYFATCHACDLKIVVAAFTIGVLIQILPPLVQALRLMKPTLAGVQAKLAARALAKYRPEIIRCLFHSNLSGYLKFAISPGDLFILGLLSTPTQVALYGLARQLTAPLALLQTNIQTAITPEITSLAARREFGRLKRLAVRYTALAFVVSCVLMACALLVGRSLILWLSRPDYIAALPVFYALSGGASLMLISLLFRPLALSLDLLRWYNLALFLSTVVLFFFIIAGWLNALTMALIQLAGVLIFRLLFNIPVWMRMRVLIVNSSKKDES
jgi:O-antigen/teichoic acid export membrane protein